MAQESEKFVIDHCPLQIDYSVEQEEPSINSLKRTLPVKDEADVKRVRIGHENSNQNTDNFTSRLTMSECKLMNDIDNAAIKADIKYRVENTPGEYHVDYKCHDGSLLITPPPRTYEPESKTNIPALLRFDQIDKMPLVKTIVMPSRTFISIPNAFATCEENIQSLLMFLSSEGDLDTTLFGSLVASLLNKKNPMERRYLCHKIFSSIANAENFVTKNKTNE